MRLDKAYLTTPQQGLLQILLIDCKHFLPQYLILRAISASDYMAIV